ncbi:hypothetical protein DY000_02028999 [Brassica cretica]|uniref:Uncharacterized protein n=1 Tax=Brassica cretica TaxID=69181 RepID=A0ABQ7DX41_BRACR|nr:hypothetical protein DY000_02028999 [Brassica cretica]
MVHRVIEANDSGYDIKFFSRSVRQTTYLGSRLAVDDLPGSRLAVDDLPGSRLVNAEMMRQLHAVYGEWYDIEFFSRSVRQTTYLGSRLAVDNLPGSRLVNAEKFDFPRRLTFQSSGEN